jgi:methyl coenzyme M reductase gamma subunit
MSKRFGRNQKRRMRAEIALRDAALDAHRRDAGEKLAIIHDQAAKMNEQSRIIRDLEEEIQDAKDVLGAEFIGFRASDELVAFIDNSNRPIIRDLASHRRLTAVNYSMADVTETIKMIPLDVLATTVDQDVYRAMQHIRLQINGTGKLAYGLTMQELYKVPRQVMWKRISEEFTRLFVQQIKEMNP